jgi:hypothetical protein
MCEERIFFLFLLDHASLLVHRLIIYMTCLHCHLVSEPVETVTLNTLLLAVVPFHNLVTVHVD